MMIPTALCRSAISRSVASASPPYAFAAGQASSTPAGSNASFSSSSIARSSSTPQPNRTTAAFHEMKRTCPDEMRAYAECVVRGHREGTLGRDACGVEFDLVRACFRSARASFRDNNNNK